MVGSLTPEQLVSVVDEDDMYHIENHVKRCQECSDGSKCWDFDYDPYQGIVLAVDGGTFTEKECAKHVKYCEARALLSAGVGKRFLDCPSRHIHTHIRGTGERIENNNSLCRQPAHGGRHDRQGATHCGTGGHW